MSTEEEASIEFFTEDVNFELSDPQKTRHWIELILRKQDFNLVQINYIFCTDEYLHKINLQYLEHDTYTDIITFDQSEQEKDIEADIFISIERIEENAHSLENTFDKELHRVMIHGVLHLMGYSDKLPEEKEIMRKKEDSCLSLYFY